MSKKAHLGSADSNRLVQVKEETKKTLKILWERRKPLRAYETHSAWLEKK